MIPVKHSRVGKRTSRVVHTHETAGSNPRPATNDSVLTRERASPCAADGASHELGRPVGLAAFGGSEASAAMVDRGPRVCVEISGASYVVLRFLAAHHRVAPAELIARLLVEHAESEGFPHD